MKLKQRIKLVKLANNNPNEHEANLAARRVCKMIEAANFNFNIVPPSNPRPQSSDFNMWVGFDPFEIIMKAARARQKSKPQQPPDFGFKQRVRSPVYGYSEIKFDPTRYQSPGNIKRNLKCKDCGEIKETRFQGLPDIWVCMDCRAKI